MSDLLKKMSQRMEEAGKDTEWLEKFKNATTWEEFVNFLAEKKIEATEEMKEIFEKVQSKKTEKLSDDELEKVSGGGDNFFRCPQEYSLILCDWTRCPHRYDIEHVPDKDHYQTCCDLGFWQETRSYPGRFG